MYAYVTTDSVMDSIDEEAFEGYMHALSQCHVDPKFDGDTLVLRPYDREECIRLIQETFDTIYAGEMDDSHPSYITVRYDDPAVTCLVFKALK